MIHWLVCKVYHTEEPCVGKQIVENALYIEQIFITEAHYFYMIFKI